MMNVLLSTNIQQIVQDSETLDQNVNSFYLFIDILLTLLLRIWWKMEMFSNDYFLHSLLQKN